MIFIENQYKIVVEYDNRVDPRGYLELTFYIDGEKKRRLLPGRNEFVVTPGFHRCECCVYNDYAEEASWLGPVDCRLAAGETYYIDIPDRG